MLGDDGVIQHRLAAAGSHRVIHLEEPFADVGDGPEITARPDLIILRADARLRPRQHVDRRLRVGEALQPTLAQ
jgi:hypothetical protein